MRVWLFVFVAALLAPADALIRRNAKQFRGCLINGKDVDIARFCAATRAYCDLLHQFGRFSGPSSANVKQCLEKVEAAQHALMRHASPRQRRALRSMKGLLKAELAHEPPIHEGSALHDPSAAVGLLWVRRGLYMWQATFEQQVQALKERIKLAKKGPQGSGAPALSLSAQCQVAYANTVAPLHGPVSRTAFNVACRAMPDWDIVVSRARLSRTDEGLLLELKAWCSALREVCAVMKAIQLQLGLEDTRKCV